VAFLGLAIFQLTSLPAKRQEVAAAEDDLVLVRQRSEKLAGILSEAKTIATNVEVAQQALPTEDAVPALITQLEQMAKESGVGVQHLGFGEGKVAGSPVAEEGTETVSAPSEMRTISLTAVVDGSYGALQTFFRNLENVSRVVNVTNFRFSPVQKKEEETSLSITLGLEAFYLPKAEGAAAEAPLTLDTGSKEYIELIKKVKELRVCRPEVGD
jgi:Tfp pilus assembly protein PilO